ncbi:hypothetical protein IMSHALPRED_008030 [Imshaugia aleurites]|uniref:Uncharacterized protein n=1 Tax=Imshaugia aleurites TaxID=172621 RepID=A0A8H3FS89_9LECA|nr:hypothetical protein IMSHALPRED_008030 [Imshaugia aleurites]
MNPDVLQQHQSHTQLQSPSTTSSSMASTISNPTSLGDPKNGGALFTLPRELRDEVYRLLVKRRYTVFGDPSHQEPDLAILRVSRAISCEAQKIFHSESILQYQINLQDYDTVKAVKSSAQPINHMKKVKMLISGLEPKQARPFHRLRYLKHATKICAATINNFMGGQISRDNCYIQFPDFNPDMIGSLKTHILPTLAAFTGFRTLLIVVVLEDDLKADAQKEMKIFKETGSAGEILKGFGSVRRVIRKAMEPTLGPAKACKYRFAIGLEFHPSEHVPSILRAQAQKLLLDADRLEQHSSFIV